MSLPLDASAGGIISLGAVFTALIFICVPLRFVARKKQKAALGADDLFMVLASLAFLGGAIVLFIGASNKVLGYPSSKFTPGQLKAGAKLTSILEILSDFFSILCLACTKASALLFYKRIWCPAGYPVFKAIIYTSLAIIALWCVVFEFLAWFQCGLHFAALWDGDFNQYCLKLHPFIPGLVISDVLLDFWILALPIPKILVLHATPRKKLAIIGVFMIGLGAFAAGLTRMAIFIQLGELSQAAFEALDQEAVTTKQLYYIVLETGLSTLAINMICLWSLISTTGPGLIRSMRSMISLRSLSRSHETDQDDNLALNDVREAHDKAITRQTTVTQKVDEV